MFTQGGQGSSDTYSNRYRRYPAPAGQVAMPADGPTAHWVGPETLVGLQVEGMEVNALADSGSQVNTMMPGYVPI